MCEVRGKEFVRTVGTGLFLREVDREISGVEGTICRIFPYRYLLSVGLAVAWGLVFAKL
jgi:hypothetical protein